MKRRTILKNQLTAAWSECMHTDYPRRSINGERALQALMFHRLTTLFEFDGMAERRLILIEPSFTFHDSARVARSVRLPDLVICDPKLKKIIGVIELKFHPRVTLKEGLQKGRSPGATRTGTTKDLDTLRRFAEVLADARSEGTLDRLRIAVDLDRYLGKPAKGEDTVPAPFTVAENLLIGWAGVYKGVPHQEKAGPTGKLKVESLAGFLGRSKLKDEIQIQGGFLELHAVTASGVEPLVTEIYSGW